MFLHSKETKLVTDLADGSNPSTYTNSTTILLKAASDNKSLAELPVPFVITDWKPLYGSLFCTSTSTILL
jgi:hypothetical protein